MLSFGRLCLSLLILCLSGVAAADSSADQASASEAKPADLKLAVGGGVYHLPRWIGARSSETILVPYLEASWQDRVELSTTRGLTVDLIHGERLHGGLSGTMIFGRSRHDLQGLADRLGTLKNTEQLGFYAEYAVVPSLSLGGRWRHDIQNTGAAYTDVYADIDLPSIDVVEHGVRLSAERMNQAAMRRFFGLTATEAALLGVSPYSPTGGTSRVSASYETYLPTSKTTGFIADLGVSRLVGQASSSPLIQNFGRASQYEAMAAFLVRF